MLYMVGQKKKTINLEFSCGQIFVSGNAGFVRFVRSYRPGYRYWKNTGYIVLLPGLLVPGWAGQNFLCSQSDVMKKISEVGRVSKEIGDGHQTMIDFIFSPSWQGTCSF